MMPSPQRPNVPWLVHVEALVTSSLAILVAASLALLVATPLAVSVDAAPQGSRFSSQVNIVRLDALVTNGGQPVLGLQPADFEISDNGVSQTAELVTFEEI